MNMTTFAAAFLGLALTLPAAPRPTAEEAELAKAKAELAKLQAARDSVAAARWSLRRQTMDLRESWNVEYERVSDSLDAASARRGRLLGGAAACDQRQHHDRDGQQTKYLEPCHASLLL